MQTSDPGDRWSGARRYLEALAGGIAIAFVIFVGAPGAPLTYPIAIGFFTIAIVLVWADR